MADQRIVELTDGRRGFFYLSHFVGNLLFQPVNEDDYPIGAPELADEDHEPVSSGS